MKLVVWKMDIVGHLITVCHFFVGFGGGGVGSLVGCNFEITARNAQNLKFLIVVSRYAEVIVSK